MENEDIRITFSNNLNRFMNLNNENLTKLANSVDVSYSTAHDWSEGNKMPRPNSLKKLAEHYNTDVQKLVISAVKDSNIQNTYNPSNNTKIIEKLITTNITDKQLNSIMTFIDFITKDNKK